MSEAPANGLRHLPATEEALAAIVKTAHDDAAPLAVSGNGSKAGIGRDVQTAAEVSTAGMTGITLHEPSELVIAARAGTPIAEIEQALAAKGQMLPFEPMDHRMLLGSDGAPTVGGIAGANVSGPRRIQAGACRDSMIGVRFVNGRGEAVKSGGRVMKNVTGYDLVKLMAGSWGTLGILTEVVFKVLPRPEAETTLIYRGLDDGAAIRLMSAALGSPFEVSAAAHRPARRAASGGTMLRLENVPASIAYRGDALAALLSEYGTPERAEGEASMALWRGVRDVADFSTDHAQAIWRLSTAPSRAAALVARIRAQRDAEVLYDWGGGLVWLETGAEGDGGEAAIRAAIGASGGHATLVRAPDALRAASTPFEPPSAGVAALNRAMKASFDPARILNPGRMHVGL